MVCLQLYYHFRIHSKSDYQGKRQHLGNAVELQPLHHKYTEQFDENTYRIIVAYAAWTVNLITSMKHELMNQMKKKILNNWQFLLRRKMK